MSAKKILKLELREIGGREILDIRICVQNGSGEFLPTKKGFSLSPGRKGELIQCLKELGEMSLSIELEEL